MKVSGSAVAIATLAVSLLAIFAAVSVPSVYGVRREAAIAIRQSFGPTRARAPARAPFAAESSTPSRD